MFTDIVTVIAKIAEEIKRETPPEEIVNLINNEKAYDMSTVAAAYSWIQEKVFMNLNSEALKKDDFNQSFRFLSEHEKNLIGFKNYNYLLNFYNLKILNEKEIEIIIDRLKMLPERSINLDNINILILSLFLDMEPESLPGSRFMLYSSDTIN